VIRNLGVITPTRPTLTKVIKVLYFNSIQTQIRAQNYLTVSTVAKKTLYDYKNVFGRVVEPFIRSKDLDEVSHVYCFVQLCPQGGRIANQELLL
jgi:hypothetical protein